MDSSDATSKGMSQDGRTHQEAAVPPQQVRVAPQLDTETPSPVPGGFLLVIIYPQHPLGRQSRAPVLQHFQHSGGAPT